MEKPEPSLRQRTHTKCVVYSAKSAGEYAEIAMKF